ncbi:MAG: hypothetical protein HKN94_15420 [Acidimicrobiales bacterium]|nr:hypothetical protein [Acidimicrobiales bacterium]
MTDIVDPDLDTEIDLRTAPDIDTPANHPPAVEGRLAELIELVEAAPSLPLSTSSKINREQVLDLLLRVREDMPVELQQARWLLREREEYLERVRLEGEEILTVARSRAERMVERTEVVKSAEHRAQRLIADAEADARRMRRETEDFCDARLASLEGILDRTRTVVATGRNRLQGVTPSAELAEQVADLHAATEAGDVFDQDFS